MRSTPPSINSSRLALSLVSIAIMTLMTACSVQQNNRGDHANVDIRTPVGGMKVSTSVDAAKDVGLAVYPGARLKPDSKNDSSAANVNLSTSFFGLRVAALQYVSDDPADKIIEFYRTELAHYGQVLECGSSHGVGNVKLRSGPSRELKCDHPTTGETLELKVGTEDDQHVVGIKPTGKGTEFSLVYVRAHGRGEPI